GDQLDRQVLRRGAQHALDHRPAEVALGHYSIGFPVLVAIDYPARPTVRTQLARGVLEHIEPAVLALPGHYDADIIAFAIALRARGVDRHDNAAHRRRSAKAMRFEIGGLPQRAVDVLEELCIELLPAEPCTL